MAVYVDKLFDYSWRHGPSCHLIADSIAELKEFAVKIGMSVDWYQPLSSPHFDLTVAGREAAVANGAVELSNRDFVAKLRSLRERRLAGEPV